MKRALLIAPVICLLLLASCSSSSSDDTSSDSSGYDLTYSERDLDSSYDESSSTIVSFSNDTIDISGDGAKTSENDLVISKEGTYILSGTLEDGQILIDTPDDEKVQLVLNGITVSSFESAPLMIKEADKVFITLPEESSNKLTGPSAFSKVSDEDGIDGVIYSKGDLTINGSGALDIIASEGHGIVSKDDLVITGGNIDISSSGDGIQGKDCVKINDCNLNIDADNDGIKSTNSEDKYRGFISIDGGSIKIKSGYDGLQAETLLRFAGNDIELTTGGGSENASTNDDWTSGWGGPGGGPHSPGEMHNSDMNETDSANEDDDISAKGLKAGAELIVSGGKIISDSSDDAIHSNGSITINDGDINISSGDDGLHADSDLIIDGGEINIEKSYEGIEGNTITLNSGNIDITATDDGLNAAGGNDSSSMDRPGANEFDSDDSAFIKINGGKLNIHASGDGIDSNGTLNITGGTTVVTCPTQGDTAVLDYASEAAITGGTFVGTGAVQMAMTFSSSEQGVIAANIGSQTPGSKITVEDSSGNTVISHTPDDDFVIAILSTPDLISGELYTISAGSVSGEIAAD